MGNFSPLLCTAPHKPAWVQGLPWAPCGQLFQTTRPAWCHQPHCAVWFGSHGDDVTVHCTFGSTAPCTHKPAPPRLWVPRVALKFVSAFRAEQFLSLLKPGMAPLSVRGAPRPQPASHPYRGFSSLAFQTDSSSLARGSVTAAVQPGETGAQSARPQGRVQTPSA